MKKTILFYFFIITFHFTFLTDVYSMQKYFGLPSKITDWDINCSVDKGGIIDSYPTYIFKTSKNRCGGGFKQRSQITTSKAIFSSIKSKYNFQSIFSINDKSVNKENFDIFSIHDGRKNCAPPLVLSIESDGVLNLRGDYKTGPGEQCERDVLNSKSFNSTTIKRDGTKYKLNLIIQFNGNGSFSSKVYLNNILQLEANYLSPKQSGYFVSKYFSFKHGVYSKNIFDYTLTSKISMRLVKEDGQIFVKKIIKEKSKIKKNIDIKKIYQKGINKVKFVSGNNLQSYNDIILNKNHQKIKIDGDLFLPSKCSDKKMPAVIIQHGSGSPKRSFYSQYARALNKEGIIAMVPDLYTTRGIKTSTGSNQGLLSKATRLYDSFAAFKFLRGLSCVDPNRVGITGYSFGGIIALNSVENILVSKLGDGFVYKASLPVYPSCQAVFKDTNPTKTKVHILAGSLDDFTPASYCIDMVKSSKFKKWDIDITVLDGAHHGFNLNGGPRRIKKSWTFSACGKILIDNEGYELNNKFNISTKYGWKKYVKTLVKNCGKRGVTVGGEPKFVQKTLDFTVNFFKNNL